MDFILSLFLIIFLISLLIRLFAPYILKFMVKRISKRFQQTNSEYYKQSRNRKQRAEGEVIIEQSEIKDKIIDENIGEYIDFEEENTN